MSTSSSPALSRTAGAAYWTYRNLLSPLLHAFSPSQCLYRPTCSEYAYVSFVRFGALRGSWLALKRVARCHPWAAGGFDPVPEAPAMEPQQPGKRLP
jgi:putative membrane protein insertion efficiency factor